MKYHLIYKATADPLFHPGWIKFNEIKWGLKAENIIFEPNKGSSWRLETLVYRNKRGKLVNPPRNPYLPVYFECASDKLSVVNRRKRMAFEKLAAFYKENGLKSGIQMSPIVNDARPFTLLGLDVSPRYTYHIDLANFVEKADSNVFKKAKKAKRLGYSCEVSYDFKAVQQCLKDVELRKDFDHKVSADDMQRLYEFVGDEGFTAFLCRDYLGNPQGARVILYAPEGMVMAWSAGIKTAALKDGVNNLLGEFALNFFYEKGCKVFDFGGANTPPVAKMKEAWGGELVCYFSISQRNLKYWAKEIYFTVKDLLKR